MILLLLYGFLRDFHLPELGEVLPDGWFPLACETSPPSTYAKSPRTVPTAKDRRTNPAEEGAPGF